jgi:hypothetical protein
MYIDSWNIQTQTWLKFVCYERVSKFKSLSVFVLTIIWHGLEAKFIFSFVTLGILVAAGRSVGFIYYLHRYEPGKLGLQSGHPAITVFVSDLFYGLSN